MRWNFYDAHGNLIATSYLGSLTMLLYLALSTDGTLHRIEREVL